MKTRIFSSIAMLMLTGRTMAQVLTANAGIDTTICSYTASFNGIRLGDNPTAAGTYPPFTFRWSPNLSLSYDTIANPVVKPTTSIVYHLTVTDVRGDTATDSIAITLTPTPSAAMLIANPDKDTICAGTLITFTVVPDSFDTVAFFDGGSEQSSGEYTWSTSSLQDSPIIGAIVTKKGCPILPNHGYTNDYTVRIISSPYLNVVPDTMICPGQPVIITATDNQVQADSFNFWINSMLIHSGIPDTFSYTFNSNDTVMVAGVNKECTGPFSQAVIITVDTPSVFITGDTESCGGTTAFFTAHGVMGGTSPVYQWLVDNVVEAQNTTIFSANSLKNNDTVSCRFISSTPCGNPNLVSSPIVVKVSPTPSTPVINQHNDTLISSPATSYQWYDNNYPINNANGQEYVPATAGSYSVATTDSNGCNSFSIYLLYTGILDLIEDWTVAIFPNPSTNYINIITNNFTPLKISLIDMAGRKLIDQRFVKQIDISSLPPGIYFVELRNENGLLIRKIVKI